MPKPAAGKLPAGVTANELVSPAASAVSITNRGKQAVSRRSARLRTGLEAHPRRPRSDRCRPANRSGCRSTSPWGRRGCAATARSFSAAEHIVYATAELLSIEFENGILAMEFAAPSAGEMVLQLARKPVGPFLAAGKPTEFEWDDKALRARFTIPANHAAGNRVRVGIAMEEPETSAFFNDASRLIIGQKQPGFHGLLVGRSGGALAPAPAGGLHRRPHYEIAQRDRLRNRHARRGAARRFRRPGSRSRWRPAGPRPPADCSARCPYG